MTVLELIDFLKAQPPDATVITSRDPEGNGFNQLSGDFYLCETEEEKDEISYEICGGINQDKPILLLWVK